MHRAWHGRRSPARHAGVAVTGCPPCPRRWDASKNALIRYHFKEQPDLEVLPPGAQLISEAEDSEEEGSSEWETDEGSEEEEE